MCAHCPYVSEKHTSPELTCSCGVYVQYDLPARQLAGDAPDVVWGLVSIWGRVIADSYEARAQYARIELLALPPCEEPLKIEPGAAVGRRHGDLKHLGAHFSTDVVPFVELRRLAAPFGWPAAAAIR